LQFQIIFEVIKRFDAAGLLGLFLESNPEGTENLSELRARFLLPLKKIIARTKVLTILFR